MIYALLAGFAVGLLAPVAVRALRDRARWLITLLPLGLFTYFSHYVPRIQSGERIFFHYSWLPDLEIGLSLCLDGLSLLFALLITVVGAIVCAYSGEYLSGHRDLGRFYATLLAFMASMLGVVLSDNLIALFVFWELTSVTSYVLIGFDHEREAARSSALQALLVTGLGGLTLLTAFLLMKQVTGTFETSAMLQGASQLTASPLYPAIFFLILAGAATKSAQIPFHFWLPNAMEAPTPVSTYLHAATMVKAGVYLLARFSPILGGTELWQNWIIPLGAGTMVTGAWLALVQKDLKRILACTTVSALGICVLLIGMGTPTSLHACMLFLAAHGLYKGGLFLVAGIIDHETGTRDAEDLGRLGRAMPLTCAAAFLTALSSAGVYPFLGFIGKELLYESTLNASLPFLFTSSAVFTGMVFVTMGGIVAVRPFFRGDAQLPKIPHEPPPGMWLGPLVFGSLGLLLGLFPGILHSSLIVPAVHASLGQSVALEHPAWHGWDLKLLLSIGSLLAGGAVFWKWSIVRKFLAGWSIFRQVGPAALYDSSLTLLEVIARRQTRFFQSGRLNIYLLTVVLTAVAFLSWALSRDELSVSDLLLHRWRDVRLYEAIIAVVLLTATVVAVKADSLLVAIVALGVVGYSVALVFLLFSAPDLAMTQFAIETLSVILLMLVLFRLPRLKNLSRRRNRLRDGIIALSAGAVTALLVLAVNASRGGGKIVTFYAENSLVLAKGRNVVNVILVDFRGFDTLGEITVLTVAAIGVYSLVKLRVPSGEEGDR